MHNFEHEIPYPKDKALYTFLWCDYFHDSSITDLQFSNIVSGRQDLTLTLQCERECRKNWQDRNWNVRAFRADLERNIYTYHLTFFGVEHTQLERSGDWWQMEYVNGRFKDSALLHRLQQQVDHPLYHVRIQLSGGYLDVVFRRFQVRKAVGRVQYISAEQRELFEQNRKQRPYVSPEECDRIRRDIRDKAYGEPEVDDIALYYDLEALYHAQVPDLGELARQCFQWNWPAEDALPYAAYILGKTGGRGDLPLLYPLLSTVTEPLLRRNLLDAIERLSEK